MRFTLPTLERRVRSIWWKHEDFSDFCERKLQICHSEYVKIRFVMLRIRNRDIKDVWRTSELHVVGCDWWRGTCRWLQKVQNCLRSEVRTLDLEVVRAKATAFWLWKCTRKDVATWIRTCELEVFCARGFEFFFHYLPICPQSSNRSFFFVWTLFLLISVYVGFVAKSTIIFCIKYRNNEYMYDMNRE